MFVSFTLTFFGAGSLQEGSPKRADTSAILKKEHQQKQKRKLILPSEESETLGEEVVEQEQEVPLQRTKRQKVATSSSDTFEHPSLEADIIVVEKELTLEKSEPQIEEKGIEKEPVVSPPKGEEEKKDYCLSF